MQEKKQYERKNSTRKNIRFPDDLLIKITVHNDYKNLSSWVIDACKDKLNKTLLKPQINFNSKNL